MTDKGMELEEVKAKVRTLLGILADVMCRCGWARPSEEALDPALHQEWCGYRQTMEQLGWENSTKD